MNKQKTYKMLLMITPPILVAIAKKSSLSPLLKKILFTSQKKIKPNWRTINNGILKGRKIFIDPIGNWQKEIINGEYDKFIFDYLKKIDLKNKIIFDIGSHIGYHTLCFAELVGNEGRVISFEPNIFNLDRIRLNLEENNNLSSRIKVVTKAVSNKIGEEDFVFSEKVDKGTSSGSFLGNANTFWEKDLYEKSYGFARKKVETITIDDFANDNELMPDLIKLDIEGAEHLALEGAQKILASKKPILLIEVHSIFNMYKVSALLNIFAYEIELLKEERDGRCFIAAK
jgi:FkbM family methyltransferase